VAVPIESRWESSQRSPRPPDGEGLAVPSARTPPPFSALASIFGLYSAASPTIFISLVRLDKTLIQNGDLLMPDLTHVLLENGR